MESPEEPPPGGCLINLVIKENTSKGSLEMPKVRVPGESLCFKYIRNFLLR